MRVVRTIILLFSIFLLPGAKALGQSPRAQKKFWTYPMTPKIKATSPLKVSPAFQIPDPIESYRFKIIEINQKKPTGKARVYLFDDWGRRVLAGELPVGQKVTLEGFRRFSDEHYYLIKDGNRAVWIGGKALGVDVFEPAVK